jgi:hypothetical protein
VTQAPQRQLFDAERIAILDKRIATITNSEYHRNTIVHREPFSAVIRMRPSPVTKSDHFWCLVLTIFSLGLGILFWLLLMYLKNSESRVRLVRLDVTPTGQIVTTKLPPIALENFSG